MEYVIDELQKALKYHNRQLDENLNKVRSYEEGIEDLKPRIEKHITAITEIRNHIEELLKAE